VPEHIPTATELSATINLDRPTREDLERLHAAIGGHGMARVAIDQKARDAGRDKLASEARAFDQHGEEMGRIGQLAMQVSERLPLDPANRKLRFGSSTFPSTTGDLGRQERLSSDQSVEQWMAARGQIAGEHRGASFTRYLRGLVTGEWGGAEVEKRMMQLAMSEGVVGAGGHLVPAPLSGRVIDLARNAMQVMRAGAITVPMDSSTLKIARLTGEGSPAWHSENAAITDQDLAFDAVTFTARTLTRLVKLSIELFEDADPSSEDVIARSFAGQMAVEVDRAALLGTGTAPEPRGVLNQSGVTLTSHGAAGSAITNYDWWLDAIGAVRAAGFEPNAHIQAPRSSTSLSKLKEATTNAYLAPPSGLLPMLTTRSVPINITVGASTDTSYVFTAQSDQLMLGIRTGFTLRFLGERFLADTLSYSFVAYLRADVQLAQPTAFVVDTGVRA
jgi:HK97 family phage major capsid protein